MFNCSALTMGSSPAGTMVDEGGKSHFFTIAAPGRNKKDDIQFKGLPMDCVLTVSYDGVNGWTLRKSGQIELSWFIVPR